MYLGTEQGPESESVGDVNGAAYYAFGFFTDDLIKDVVIYAANFNTGIVKPVLRETGLDVGAGAISRDGNTGVVMGDWEKVRGETRHCAILYKNGAESESYFFDLGDDIGQFISMSVVCDAEEIVFYLAYATTKRWVPPGGPGAANTVLYRWDPAHPEPEEFSKADRILELVGAPGGNKLYVTYIDDLSEFPWQKYFGYLDKETGEYRRLPFEPPGRTHPGDFKWTRAVPYPPGEERYGPVYYFYQSEPPHMGGGYTNVYVRDPEKPGTYRHLRIEYSVIDLLYSYEDDLLVYIDHFDEEPRAPKIVVKNLRTDETKFIFLPVSLPPEALPSPFFHLLYVQ